MLFRKKIDPRCVYCERGCNTGNGHIICVKKGIMEEGDHCRAFIYDPLKREPPAPAIPDFSHMNDGDFTL